MKVIFRKFREGDIIALFPTEPGTNEPSTCMCYQHVGQHGAADAGLTRCTKAAKPEEAAPLLAELKAIGYDDLRIVDRMHRNDYLTRRDAIANSGRATA